jgi:hypothetical protein
MPHEPSPALRRVRFAHVLGLGALVASTVVSGAAFGKAKAAADKTEKTTDKFVCTQIMGVSVTGDWFGAGFEKAVDERRFQAITRKKAFIDLWADPKNEIWSVPIASPCAERSNNPDRIVFTGVNWEFKTVEEWTGAYTKVVEVLKAKYPGVRRIELLTMLRGPGNKSCGNDQMTVVAPVVDEAIARIIAANPKLVTAGPKIETPTCAVFTKGGPHYTDEGMADVAKLYAAHYAKH